MHKIVLFVILVLFSSMALASKSIEEQMDLLKEAQDYLSVKPSQTLQILESMTAKESLPTALKIRWHIIRVRASVTTNQLDIVEQSLARLFTYDSHPYFNERLTTILSALGIWLRRKGHLREADISLVCALKYTDDERKRMLLINSRALVARHMGKHTKARELYKQAETIAKALNARSTMATINNNLGAIALDLGDYTLAEAQFRLALAGYQEVAKRSGHITAGLNLLLVFVINGEVTNYQRLYGPVAALTEAFPNQSKKALLAWTFAAYEAKQGKALSSSDKAQLKLTYEQLESGKVKSLVDIHLAPIVGIEPPKSTQQQTTEVFQRAWFDKVSQCNWQ
ncbi:tetratricopeptide repeat protein [Pseudoalteromonas luteoviolacea]|uniref:tetratricopeptide repeat protein n=1 Tax=Pseudoalteromonas luteoviolacea TaxID=43657 RepID=UPI00114DDF1D|nr:tetratricopeptide repeat protein [Pseudoalteromonas luteoviolacea]TQF68042.1 tetratricopeptide repeat protein [Pseudoalteromonas luteoviolacea]